MYERMEYYHDIIWFDVGVDYGTCWLLFIGTGMGLYLCDRGRVVGGVLRMHNLERLWCAHATASAGQGQWVGEFVRSYFNA